jgi:hypothetical protein
MGSCGLAYFYKLRPLVELRNYAMELVRHAYLHTGIMLNIGRMRKLYVEIHQAGCFFLVVAAVLIQVKTNIIPPDRFKLPGSSSN